VVTPPFLLSKSRSL